MSPRFDEQLAAGIKTRDRIISPHAVTTIGEPGTERRTSMLISHDGGGVGGGEGSPGGGGDGSGG